jgi:hypothetical protein
VLALTAVSAFADADDELFTKEVGGTTLRDINTVSTNQPSAIELVNTEPTKLEIPGVATSECTEAELGSLVTRSVATVANPQDELSVPFGVFENCMLTGGIPAPVYVDTEGTKKAASGIEATIADTGPGTEIKVTLTGLKLSLYIKEPATTCKFTGTIVGKWANGAGPFTEESATNQSTIDFKGQKLASTACGTATLTAAKFFVETTSDPQNFVENTDTASFKAPPCVSVPAVTFGKENEARMIVIANCSKVVRADIIEVSTDNEAEFKAAKKCVGVALATEGNAGDKCTEQVTFSGKCAKPPASANFVVEILQGGKMFKSKLTGC